MFEKAIQKLKTERAKLTKGAKEINAKYKNEIRPIDTAIQKFEEGIVALGSKDLVSRKSATQEIENILAEFGAIHARVVTEKLHRYGYSMVLQSCPVLFKLPRRKREYTSGNHPPLSRWCTLSKESSKPILELSGEIYGKER